MCPWPLKLGQQIPGSLCYGFTRPTPKCSKPVPPSYTFLALFQSLFHIFYTTKWIKIKSIRNSEGVVSDLYSFWTMVSEPCKFFKYRSFYILYRTISRHFCPGNILYLIASRHFCPAVSEQKLQQISTVNINKKHHYLKWIFLFTWTLVLN